MSIGVDCGTQSTKVVVVDVEEGLIRGEASRHHLDEGEHGRREQAPSEWLTALKGAFFEALERAGVDAGQVRGIGVSGQQHGMVALDADGVPVYLWCDTETSAHNSDLVARLGGESGCLEKLGLVLQCQERSVAPDGGGYYRYPGDLPRNYRCRGIGWRSAGRVVRPAGLRRYAGSAM
ncbi:MAG: FGGY family carbohydrate kinase [Pseudomonadota bacterium]